MKITVAIPAYHSHNRLLDCIQAIKNQRVIQADAIRVYDISMPSELSDYVRKENCEIRTELKNFIYQESFLMAGIIDDNKDTDILILVDPSIEISRSSISEYFRLFLKFNDLALVYGRQMPSTDNTSLLTRFWFGHFYPIIHREDPLWHINRIFCSYRMMALRMSLLKPEFYHPANDYRRFGDIYLGAMLMKNNFRLMYNPLALGTIHSSIKTRDVFEIFRDLQYFLLDNAWMKPLWYLRSNEVSIFTKQLFNYLHTYSSHPLTWLSGILVYANIITGLYIGRHNYQSEHEHQERGSKYISPPQEK